MGRRASPLASAAARFFRCSRAYASCTLAAWTILLNSQLVVPEMNFSAKRIAAIGAAVGAGYIGIMTTIAYYWRFPIPFTLAIGAAPFGVFLNLFVLGSRGFSDRDLLKRYLRFANFIGLHTSMVIVYPVYNAVFLSLDGIPQLAFVLLLPVIKIGYKFATIALQTDNDDDLIPALHLGVDIFDALYMTKCMQSAGTLMAAFGIIVVDLAQNYLAIYLLAKQAQHLQALNASEAMMCSHQSLPDLFPLMFGFLKKTQQLDDRSLRFGSRKLSVSTHSEAELERLRSIQKTIAKSNQAVLANTSTSAVHPSVPTAALIPVVPQPGSYNQTDIFQETTCLLHESEAVAVVEYIEAVVPVLYVIYISILFRLPNAKYYLDMQQMTETKLHRVVVNALLYAVVERLSLVYVFRMLKRNFGVSMFYQLAFALETDWKIYQCNFISWILVAFQFLLIYCCDFTFKFEWGHID